MAAFLDLCRFVAAAGGTTDWAYSSTVSPYISPAEAGAVSGRVYKVRAESTDLTQWEVSEGTYSSAGAGSFARTAVLYNSAGTGTKQGGAGTKVSFTAAPQVWVVASKLDLLSIEEANAFTTTQKAQARANIDALKKNYIVNGAMMVSQENGGTGGSPGTSYYPVDQFFGLMSNAGTASIAQVASATPAGSPNRIRWSVTGADASVAAGDYALIDTRIEGYRVADLLFGTASGRTIIIQFGVKAPAGTYCVTVLNSASNRAYVAEYTISGGEANTDVVKSVVVPGDTSGTWLKDTGCGLVVRWGLMAGTTNQQAAGSWAAAGPMGSANQFNLMGTNGNVFELFDVGLYEGSAAPTFQVPDFDDELRDCRRFWRSSYALGTQPGTVTGLGQIRKFPDGTTSFAGLYISFDVAMRVAPTATVYSPGTGASTKWRNADAGTDLNAAVADQSINGFFAYVNNVSTGTATTLTVHYKADARM